MQKLLTIGICTYNSEPYIDELLFVLNQYIESYPYLINEIDFYIYDDHSDKINFSIYKYMNFIQSDVNKGTPSIGRNEIIRRSNSKYILFIDGDDTFIAELNTLIKELEIKNDDMLISQVACVGMDGRITNSPIRYNKKLFSEPFNMEFAIHQTGIWSIYKTSFLRDNNILYPTKFRYEDNYLFYQLLLCSPRVSTIDTIYYGWRQRNNSFSKSNNISQIESRVKIYSETLKLLSKNIDNKNSHLIYYSIFNQTYNNIITDINNLSKKERLLYFSKLNSISSRYKKEINIFRSRKITNTDKYFRLTKKNIFRSFMLINILYNVNNKKKFDLKRKITNLFLLLPLNENKIFITSQYGKYNDNSKYLYLEMKNKEEYKNTKFIFAVKDKSLLINKDFIDFDNKISFYFHHYTSKKIIFNTWVSPEIKKRKNQEWIQLWHGYPIKKIDRDIRTYKDTTPLYIQEARKKSIDRWDKVYSIDNHNDIVFKRLFKNSEIVKRQYPKTDWLIKNKNNNTLKSMIYKKYQLDPNKKYTLYAPTYRPYNFLIDLKKINNLLSKDHILIIHLHPLMNCSLVNFHEKMLFFDNVEDLQELILLTNNVISDYSSLIYEFEVIGKKVIRYDIDKEIYDKIHGIYAKEIQ